MTQGLCAAGLHHLLGVDADIDKEGRPARCLETYEANHGAGTGLRLDLTLEQAPRLVFESVAARAQGRPDPTKLVVVASPPCQSMSRANAQSRKPCPADLMCLHAVRIAARLQARYMLFENVPDMQIKPCLGEEHITVLERLTRELHQAGYPYVQHRKMHFMAVGVPQTRTRLIILASRVSQRFVWPPCKAPKPPGQHLTLRQLLLSPSHAALEERFNPWVIAQRGKRLAAKIVCSGKRGGRLNIADPDRPCRTITAGLRVEQSLLLVDRRNRYTTNPAAAVRYRGLCFAEMLAAQTFPANYAFPDHLPKTQLVRQVGNAVPPRAAAALGFALLAMAAAPLGSWTEDQGQVNGNTKRKRTHKRSQLQPNDPDLSDSTEWVDNTDDTDEDDDEDEDKDTDTNKDGCWMSEEASEDGDRHDDDCSMQTGGSADTDTDDSNSGYGCNSFCHGMRVMADDSSDDCDCDCGCDAM